MTDIPEDGGPTASATDAEENRFLRETAQRLAKLQRIFETQTPGQQGAVQAQFDNLIRQFDVLHAAAVERGFLPLDKVLP